MVFKLRNKNYKGDWREEREHYLKMPNELKPFADKFVSLDQISTWHDECQANKTGSTGETSNVRTLNTRISVWKGDITLLDVDTIVNAANKFLRGGGGVDGAICVAAGDAILEECAFSYGGCPTGEARLTAGYRLPAKYVIQTVGPDLRLEKTTFPVNPKNGPTRPSPWDKQLLANAYRNSLDIATNQRFKSIAFPCISTACFKYPGEAAAKVALETVKNYLEAHPYPVERVIFVAFLDKDVEIYRKLLPIYFPPVK